MKFFGEIITDFILARKSAAFSKTRFGSALIFSTALRDYGLLAQVHGLVCSAVTSRVYTFSIALSKYSLYPSRSQPCLFQKPCPSVPKIINNQPNQSLWLLICVNPLKIFICGNLWSKPYLVAWKPSMFSYLRRIMRV